jgi:NADPH2:quinone reductase
MRAIIATAPGGTGVLQLRQVPKPDLPSPHHVRVKLAAASVNPVDAKLRSKPAYHPDKLPAILGCDGAGVVEAVGSAVTRFKAGDAVFFCNGGLGDEPGCYAEYTTLHEDHCAAKHSSLTMEQAAALPLVFITAWESLIDRAHLQAGQEVLIHAGAGGVGHVAIQIARNLGARIATTVGDEDKAAFVRGLGAERAIHYKRDDFVSATLDWTHGKGADVVYDTVGGDTFLRSLDAARIGGHVTSILSTAMTLADVQKARLRNLCLSFELMLTPQVYGLHAARTAQRKILEQAAVWADAGKLHVHISHTLPLAQAAEAHDLIEHGHTTGKIVLTM